MKRDNVELKYAYVSIPDMDASTNGSYDGIKYIVVYIPEDVSIQTFFTNNDGARNYFVDITIPVKDVIGYLPTVLDGVDMDYHRVSSVQDSHSFYDPVQECYVDKLVHLNKTLSKTGLIGFIPRNDLRGKYKERIDIAIRNGFDGRDLLHTHEEMVKRVDKYHSYNWSTPTIDTYTPDNNSVLSQVMFYDRYGSMQLKDPKNDKLMLRDEKELIIVEVTEDKFQIEKYPKADNNLLTIIERMSNFHTRSDYVADLSTSVHDNLVVEDKMSMTIMHDNIAEPIEVDVIVHNVGILTRTPHVTISVHKDIPYTIKSWPAPSDEELVQIARDILRKRYTKYYRFYSTYHERFIPIQNGLIYKVDDKEYLLTTNADKFKYLEYHTLNKDGTEILRVNSDLFTVVNIGLDSDIWVAEINGLFGKKITIVSDEPETAIPSSLKVTMY